MDLCRPKVKMSLDYIITGLHYYIIISITAWKTEGKAFTFKGFFCSVLVVK